MVQVQTGRTWPQYQTDVENHHPGLGQNPLQGRKIPDPVSVQNFGHRIVTQVDKSNNFETNYHQRFLKYLTFKVESFELDQYTIFVWKVQINSGEML